jgi:hypothetical protein
VDLDGDLGVGIMPNSKLDVSGQATIRGGSPAPGKVLTCFDPTGLGVWMIPLVNNNRYIHLNPQSVKLPIMSGASGVRINGGGLGWNISFPSGASSASGIWQFTLPLDYSGNAQLKINTSCETVQVGTNVLSYRASIAAITPGDSQVIQSKAFDVANTGNVTLANNQAADNLVFLNIPLTGYNNSMATGDFVWLKLDRNVGVASNAYGDSSIHSMILEYTALSI